MAQLLVVNPYRHRRRANPRRGRRVRYHHRARNPRRKHWVRGHLAHRAGRRVRIAGHMSNPYRHRRRYHHRKRNPWGSAAGKFTDDVLMPSLLGAAGGVALQLTWNAFGSMIPTTISGNQLLTVATQAAAGVGLGWLAGKALGGNKGDAVAAGAVAIVLYNYVSGMISTSCALQGLRGPRRRGMGAFMPGQGLRVQPRTKVALGLGAFMPGQGLAPRAIAPRTLGAYAAVNPAPFLRGVGGGAAGRFYGRR